MQWPTNHLRKNAAEKFRGNKQKSMNCICWFCLVKMRSLMLEITRWYWTLNDLFLRCWNLPPPPPLPPQKKGIVKKKATFTFYNDKKYDFQNNQPAKRGRRRQRKVEMCNATCKRHHYWHQNIITIIIMAVFSFALYIKPFFIRVQWQCWSFGVHLYLRRMSGVVWTWQQAFSPD